MESCTVVLAVAVGVGAGVGVGVAVALTWRVAAFDVADGADVRRDEPWPQDARSRRRNGSRRWSRLRGRRLADCTLVRPPRGSRRRGPRWLWDLCFSPF